MAPQTDVEAALARWLAGGVTSWTNPILAHVLATFFTPLGIEADWLEAEPFSSLEGGNGEWWLRGARWNPDAFDPAHPAAADFRLLLGEHRNSFEITVDSQGQLEIRLAGKGQVHPAAAEVFANMENGWLAVRHSVRASHAADVFLHAAAGLILAGDPATSLFAQGLDEAFCAEVRERIGNPETESEAATPETPEREEKKAANTQATAVSPRSESEKERPKAGQIPPDPARRA